MNNLSRNRPVALVVGANSFVGSHLIEELLLKGIQVLGIDELETNRDNLAEASRDKNFQFLSESLETIENVELPRLDYAVFVAKETGNHFRFQQDFKNFLDLCLKYSAKIILCSSIDLYESNKDNLTNLKYAEKMLADKALPGKINARIVRLASVYGPRMDFAGNDPMIKLIKSAISGKLNSTPTPLEFTTRALYIKDAVKLLIKAIMHGSTAQKIYDGTATAPVKISEIKQVLMDPLWYEEKGFSPTQLPPWPTPNLHKTSKELSWSPSTNIVVALKETLAYFKDHQDKIPAENEVKERIISEPEEERDADPIPENKKTEKVYSLPKINAKILKDRVVLIAGLAVIFFALIYPVFKFGFAAVSIKMHLENSINLMSAGNFDAAENESREAGESAEYLSRFMGSLAFIKQINFLQNPYLVLEQILKITQKATRANYHIITGAKLLAAGLTVISGGKEGDTLSLLNDAKTEFGTADGEIGEVSADLSDRNFTDKLPNSFKETLMDLQSKSEAYRETVNLGRSLVNLLPGIIALDGEKNYLVVLQDNRILRPGGGQLKSYVEISFNHGKLAKIKGDSVENLDKQFADRIDPPVELKTDLGETNWRMRDASFDIDFPAGARNIAWFYNKESGTQISGVVAMDFVAMSRLLQAVGLSDDPTVKVSLGREGNKVAAQTLQSLIERIFYLSKQNWVVLAKNSEESLTQKHLLIYLTDPNAFSYLAANGWVGGIPKRGLEQTGERNEFLALSETNMTQGQDSTAIARSINIESKLDESGIVSHKLSINYTATEKLTGPYKNRLKIYLPVGTKMLKSTWGDKVIKEVSPFSDYGLSGYSMLLELGVGEQKQLSLEYQDINPAKFNNNELKYQLSIFKQPGQEAIPVDFKLNYPPEMKVTGETIIKSDLSQDREFGVILQK